MVDNKITGLGPVTPGAQPTKTNTPQPGGGPDFSEVLGGKLNEGKPEATAPKSVDGVRFSNHALERMTSRGISIKPEEMTRLNDAIERAAGKGSRETLVLMDNTAMIVNVKTKTVVTAMDRAMMKENVFTNIDSTVVI